jgi:endonuclease/exonuclease/phosphatase family metal-dependent hydrolase
MVRFLYLSLAFFSLLILGPTRSAEAQTVRIATFNVENYLEVSNRSRPAKSDDAKAKVRESIHALKPDVLALQEIGGTNSLLELQASLKSEGLDLPEWDLINGYDTNIQVAVLSRFPIVSRRAHTNDHFLLTGRRFRVTRGFEELDIRVNDHYSFTLINAHLKSRLPIPEAAEADMRLEEAKLLREKIDFRIATNPNLNLIVLGDMNDVFDSPAIKAVLGRGNKALVDTRPSEHNGDTVNSGDRRLSARAITWTHYYAREDTYTRMDYIFISRGMSHEWDTSDTYVLSMPNWGTASDHRPLVATFTAQDK